MVHDIEVLFVDDCPNLPVLLERLEAVTCGRAAIRTTRVDPNMPMPRGWAGSPTMLVDGLNPLQSGEEGSASCALRIASIEELKTVLDQ